ncbi:MAG: nitrate/nitrite response regulator protein narL [Paenibacillaceae bacterium]|jgi:DNA-binding NarL/FixJ family response regulator|nr:nitrate/nitrite response regulator protein narL [Paenibacillaceae bacterium]
MIRIAIIDDHSLVRKGLTTLISMESDLELVGEADNAEDGLVLLKEQKPELTLVDLKLGQNSGLSLIIEARKQADSGKFIILTSAVDENSFKQAEQAQVDGYVLKEALPEELLYAIQLVCKGRKYYDPGVMEHKLAGKKQDKGESLTPKEREVMCLIGEGLCNMEIAEKLFISEFTVRKHVSQILAKLELKDRTQAALFANYMGWVQYKPVDRRA